jgi:hypothetical protein
MKTITFELCLTHDESLLITCKKEIRKVFRASLKRLIDVKDDNILTDYYRVSLRIREDEIWDTARKLISIEGILDVEPDLDTSLDEQYKKLFLEEKKELEQERERPDPRWYHLNTGITEAIAYAKTEFEASTGFFNPAMTKIRIAQFDTGYTNHPEIKLINKKGGYNYIAGFIRRILSPGWQRDARDRLRNFRPFLWASHGTSTASTIIGSRVFDGKVIDGPLQDRVDGLMPHNIDLIPFRISENIISFSNKMTQAINQVIQLGDIPIVTMSHASLFPKRSWKQAVARAYEKGIIWVAAGGSHAFGKLRSIIVFPAKFRETIATAASTNQDMPWERTHYGEEIDICAPGFDMYVPSSRRRWYGLLPNRYTYKWSEGTSFSTPIVAAAAALWLAHHGDKKLNRLYPEPWQRVEAFRTILKASARVHKPGTPGHLYGAGMLDMPALLKEKLPDRLNLKSAFEDAKHPGLLATREEKLDYITGKEIIYLLGAAKLKGHDREGDTLFDVVYQAASGAACKFLDQLTRPEVLPEDLNPRSEAVKRFGKEFLNKWS